MTRQNSSRLGVCFLLLIVALISLFKGFQSEVSIWGEPYWLINYGDGFIRRGLMGQIFSLFYDRSDMTRVHAAILAFHWTACFLLIVSLWEWTRSLASNASILAMFAIFAASQFLPTIAYHPGYLDPFILLLLLASTVALMNDHLVSATIIAFIAPFIHERFLILWITPAALAVWQRNFHFTRGLNVALVAPISASVLIGILNSPSAATAQMQALPLRADIITVMINTQLGLSIGAALLEMYNQFSANFDNFLLASSFFLLPTLVIVALYGMSRDSRWDKVILLVASFAPLATLLVALDLSRFLVDTAFTAMLAVLFMETVRPTPSVLWQPIVGGPFAATYLFVPFVWAFFWAANINDNGIFPLSRTFLGQFTATAVRYYSSR